MSDASTTNEADGWVRRHGSPARLIIANDTYRPRQPQPAARAGGRRRGLADVPRRPRHRRLPRRRSCTTRPPTTVQAHIEDLFAESRAGRPAAAALLRPRAQERLRRAVLRCPQHPAGPARVHRCLGRLRPAVHARLAGAQHRAVPRLLLRRGLRRGRRGPGRRPGQRAGQLPGGQARRWPRPGGDHRVQRDGVRLRGQRARRRPRSQQPSVFTSARGRGPAQRRGRP